MNAADADDALTEAIESRDFAARMLERAQNSAHVATQNLGYAERHLAAMDAMVAQRERVQRELTIADDGGHHPAPMDLTDAESEAFIAAMQSQDRMLPPDPVSS